MFPCTSVHLCISSSQAVVYSLFSVYLLHFFKIPATAPSADRGNQRYDRTLSILIQYSFKALILILSPQPPPLSPA